MPGLRIPDHLESPVDELSRGVDRHCGILAVTCIVERPDNEGIFRHAAHRMTMNCFGDDAGLILCECSLPPGLLPPAKCLPLPPAPVVKLVEGQTIKPRIVVWDPVFDQRPASEVTYTLRSDHGKFLASRPVCTFPMYFRRSQHGST